ncbi:MAG: FecR domain-containing protein, partial [Bdellovibrionales bacterium]
MKLTLLEKRLLIFCCLVIVVFSYFLYDDSLFNTSRSSSQPQVAQLVEKKQDVRVKSSENFTWLSAQEQDSLFAFDSLFTGEQSTAILKLNDGSTLRIDGQSLVILAVENGQLILDLKSGSLTGELSPQSQLLVKTPKGIEKIGGTRSGQIRLEKGFSGATLQKVERKPASQAQIIWRSPNEFKMNKQDPRTYTNLEWKTVGDVDETLIEISANSDFKILDSVVKTKKLSTGIPTSLPQGQYFVRLKGYNKNRELSATSTVHSFNLTDIKRSLLSPPLLITQNIKHLDSDIAPPKMAWEKVESAANYRIELSRTPRFEKSVKAETASSEVTWPGVQAGSYFFRVYSLNGEDVSLPSDIGTLEISSQAPQLLPISAVSIRSENKNLGPQRIPLKWLHTTRAKPLYRIEVSKSGTFQDAKIIKSERAPATVSVTQPGEYYVRVFASNEEGEPISGPSNIEKMQYEIKNLLPAPELIRPFNETTVFLQSDDNPYLWLTWKPVNDAEQFLIEIAKDFEFRDLVESARVPASKEKFHRYLMGKRIPYGK